MSSTPNADDIERLRASLDAAIRTHVQAAVDLQALTAEANTIAGRLGKMSDDNAKLGAELRAAVQGIVAAAPAPHVATSCKSEEHSALVIELWKQTVTVQQHFNDLQLRIRNFAITVFGAVIGAIAFALKENLRFNVGGYPVSLGTIILIAGALSWLAFYFMDRWWYHMLLVGSVKQGTDLERELERDFPNALLTVTIGKYSPIRFGFAVAFMISAAGLYGLCLLAPGTVRFVSTVLVWLLLALIPASLTATRKLRDSTKRTPEFEKRQVWISSRRGRIVFIGAFILMILPALGLWWRGNDIGALIAGGLAATLFAAAHEIAGTWLMHSRHKVDVFYIAGLLVFLAIAVGIESIKSPAAAPSVMTETRTTTRTQNVGSNSTAVQTSTATTTTIPPAGTTADQTATKSTTKALPSVTATSAEPTNANTTGTQP